jgi:phospholipase C
MVAAAALAVLLAVVGWLVRAELADADFHSEPLIGRPCGQVTAAPAYHHVIWIWMENHSYGQVVGSSDAPYVNALARACGLASNYHAVSHPSLPNYLAATGGSTFAETSDAAPRQAQVRAPSVFSEVRASGRQWRSYVESMRANCRPVGPHGFARNPAAYYRNARRLCLRWDVPMGTPTRGPFAAALRTGTLPAFSMVTPNNCDSTHNCPTAAGDAWLSRWVNTIIASPAYRRGDTALFLVWDEGRRELGQHVPLVVVSPSTRPGTVSSTRFDHYSLLRTASELLHIAPPGHAATAASLGAAFGLEPPAEQ